jgi:1-acyl-sn-glycerol-3-phosphate acyltransferase
VSATALIDQAIAFFSTNDGSELAKVRGHLEQTLGEVTNAELASLLERMAGAGGDWGYHEPVALARRVNHALAELVIEPGSEFLGSEWLEVARRGPVTFLANHLSFSDANLFECLLHGHGHEAVARRLTVLAGPKVFSETFRRFSSLCFGSIKTPQSSDRASGEAVMSRREVARLASETIALVEERRRLGDHLLVFVEGTRSRSASMQPALPAVSRYLDHGETWILPLGIAGSERLVPIGEEKLHRTRVRVEIGPPFRGRDLRARSGLKRQLMMEVVGCAIALRLPPEYRGVYAADRSGHDAARAIAEELAARSLP